MSSSFIKHLIVFCGVLYCPVSVWAQEQGEFSRTCAKISIELKTKDASRRWHQRLSDRFAPTERVESRRRSIREALDPVFVHHQFEAVTRADEVQVLAEYWLVQQSRSFLRLERAERLGHLNRIFGTLIGLPTEITRPMLDAGKTLTVTTLHAGNHPDYYFLNMPSQVWDPDTGDFKQQIVCGSAHPHGVVIAVNVMVGKVETADLLLHELGHEYEYTLPTDLLWPFSVSRSAEFVDIFQSTKWEPKYNAGKNSRETFAEGFAKYFHSSQSREDLRLNQPLLYEFLEKRFGKFSFRFAA